jgi:thymidine phosphorylase
MSKKIAEGIGGLVLDVKAGDGAFMKTRDDARRLAESLVSIGEAAGVRTEALLTSMDAPLGRAVGNALEIIECAETLKGNGPPDVESLSVDLAARMLIVSGVEQDPARAEGRIRKALADGSGVEKLKQIVENQGGDPRAIDDYGRMPGTADRDLVLAPRDGFVSALKAERIGRAAVVLGAGRDRLDAVIDPAVGLLVTAAPGTAVQAGDPIVEVRHRGGRGLGDARRLLIEAIQIDDRRPPASQLILERVRGRTS